MYRCKDRVLRIIGYYSSGNFAGILHSFNNLFYNTNNNGDKFITNQNLDDVKLRPSLFSKVSHNF